MCKNCLQCLWHYWLGVRKSIRPVKIEWWGVDVVICLEQGEVCLHTVQLMPLPSPSSLTLFKSRLVLPFWYRLTQVVLEKRPLNGCSGSSIVSVKNIAMPPYLVKCKTSFHFHFRCREYCTKMFLKWRSQNLRIWRLFSVLVMYRWNKITSFKWQSAV